MQKHKGRILRILMFVIGTFLLAIDYNLILLPHNLIMGGTSGLSIILADIINPQIFITVSSLILAGFSFFLLGKEKTLRSLAGTLLYPFLINITILHYLIFFVDLM